MNSPPAEWTVLIGALALLDYIRSRGEADGDTASEVIRDLTRRHPSGDLFLGAGLAVGAVWFHRHITTG
jgi:hypothetical protein